MTLLVAGLFVAGVAALIAELFLPSLGILGVIGAASLVASVVTAYRRVGGAAGPATLAAALVVVPVLVVLFFRFFPRTFLGRRLVLKTSEDARKGFTAHAESRGADLAGRCGRALTALRPSGTVEIDGGRYDAVTSGEFIDAGEKVRVELVEGGRIVVEAQARRET